MAAVSARTITEKKCAQADVAVKSNPVYTRTVTFAVEDGATAGTANLTGFTIPADTAVLGGAVKFSAAQGACTWKFTLTTDGDICAATTNNTTSWKALTTPTFVVSTADRVVTFTTADAATTVGTATLTLYCCAVGVEDSVYSTYSV